MIIGILAFMYAINALALAIIHDFITNNGRNHMGIQKFS